VPEDESGVDSPRTLETSLPDPDPVDRLAPEVDSRAGAAPPAAPIDELARRRWDLIAAHRPAMEARAKQLCRPPCEPDDLVHDALERAFRTQSPIAEPARMRGWLLRILTNMFIDFVRKQRRLPPHVELDDDDAAAPTRSEPAMWESVSPEDVRRAIDELPEDTRETYRLFTVEGRSHAEIARAQGIPIATVASRVFRARRQLKAVLMAMHVAKRGKGDKGPR
jgi:RNA polymerase sigma-70 factor (ECF subfamily)